MKILVTGSNGQVGNELKELAPSHPSCQFYFLTRDELSLDSNEGIERIIDRISPQVVINCAAYTAVDKAESEKELAFQINGEAVGVMAKACTVRSIKFIHISTDYVFDGTVRHPLKEDDVVSPVNVYGESKLDGETKALQNNPDSIIIRTSWVYSFYGKNFVKTMVRLMSEKESISVVGDQWGSPTYAADLAEAVLHIIASQKWQPGIYHFSNDGVITWAEFATAIGEMIQSKCVVHSIPTTSYPTPAKRPLYSVMDKTKIQSVFGISLRPWKKSLQTCIGEIKSAEQQL